MVIKEETLKMLKECGITPKVLNTERLIKIFTIYKMTGQLFEGSHMSELFGHIFGLQSRVSIYEFLISGPSPCDRTNLSDLSGGT